jgi:dTDP-4-amino-4,6-dideoxygalactose transaminase
LLDRVKKLNDIRNKRARKLIKSFKEFKFIKFQKIKKNFYNSYHLLPAYFDKHKINYSRDKFIDTISQKYGIQLIIQYHPLNRYHFFKRKYKSNNNLKNTYNFYNNMFSIPSHVWMSDKDFNYLISSCRKELKKIRYLEK